LLLLAKTFSSCGKEEKPIEILFTEYSLTKTFCQWRNLGYNGKVSVINSNAELEKYITCTEGTFPKIDFSKSTLLLTGGVTAGGIDYLYKMLLFKGNGYVLKVEITLNDATIGGQSWIVVLVTDKLMVKDVELNVITIKNGKP
jgi:hypothetical protein